MENDLAQRMEIALHGKEGTVRQGAHGAGEHFSISRINAWNLVLPSGRICIADAYNADEFPPLNRIVSPGEYPVEIVIADISHDLNFGNKRAAFLVVTFSKVAPSLWQPITAIRSADPCYLDNDSNGFVQEAATAVFSPEAGAVHFAHLRQQFDEQLQRIRKLERGDGMCRWCNFKPGEGPENVITCKGGFGDGTYHCFTGIDPAGRVTHIAIDFGIVGP